MHGGDDLAKERASGAMYAAHYHRMHEEEGFITVKHRCGVRIKAVGIVMCDLLSCQNVLAVVKSSVVLRAI